MSTATIAQTDATDTRVTTPEGPKVTPEDKAMKALRAVKDPKSPEGVAALTAVGKFIVPPSKTDAQTREVEDLTEHLADIKAQRDHAVAYRLGAIKTALSKKYAGAAIAKAYGVSAPYVTYVRQGIDWTKTAQEAGGSLSLKDAVKARANLSRSGLSVDEMTQAISANGTLPDKAEAKATREAAAPKRVKVARLVSLAQGLATAARVTDYSSADLASLRTALDATRKAERAIYAMVEKASAKPAETSAA